MKKLIYSIGVTLFLAFMAFHVTTSLTNPFYGVSMEALAQGSGNGGSDVINCWDPWNNQIVPCISARDFWCETKQDWLIRCDYYVPGADSCSPGDQEVC